MADRTIVAASHGLNQWVLIGLLLAISLLLVVSISTFVPQAVDWHGVYIPAGQSFWQGGNPYDQPGFFNPPWVFLFLSPLLLLPETVSTPLIVFLQIAGFGYAAYRLGAKPLALAAVLLTEPLVTGAVNGNIDWLVAIGLLLPARWGLFFVLLKPQVGAGIALYWLWEAWKQGGLRSVIRTFTPVCAAFLLSFVRYGLWPLRLGETLNLWWNVSLFPYGIPVGVYLLHEAFKRRHAHTSAAAGVFFAPYVNSVSYSITALAFIHDTRLTVLICLLNWVAFLVPVIRFHLNQ